jgi:hypothetical protein
MRNSHRRWTETSSGDIRQRKVTLTVNGWPGVLRKGFWIVKPALGPEPEIGSEFDSRLVARQIKRQRNIDRSRYLGVHAAIIINC